ncbi:MAG TPA: UvrD-helicase domain-containing protein, partial [Terracidiphilus sp.]|nr:UvrD-helicase domain-containing protein [Terracidiphilus sp.]
MTDSAPRPQQSDPPPDQDQRSLALDPARSVLVQAPAGSGKTDLLTRRFLRLLAEVDDPGHIVAITFTRAAAAEMRHRILSELEKASAAAPPSPSDDALSMPVLAYRAYQRSIVLKWQLIDIPAQLRISTIDSFSREIALQQPLLTELGSEIGIHEMPAELYRRAARRTLETIGSGPTGLSQSIETLLRLRDNNWQEMEEQLVSMLDKRHQWMHDFVLDREPDWPALRARLERPFARALHAGLSGLSFLLNQVPEARDEILDLARFAFQQNGAFPRLASLREFPSLSSPAGASTSETISAFQEIAHLLLIKDGVFRKRVDKTIGFPPESKSEKNRLLALIGKFSQISGFGARLAGMRSPPPAGYTDDEWEIVRAAFRVLRQ